MAQDYRQAEEGEQCMDCGDEVVGNEVLFLHTCFKCGHEFCEDCYVDSKAECLSCVAGA